MSDGSNLELSRSVRCYGNAGPNDYHLAATVHCMDDEIVCDLEKLERRRRKREEKHAARFD